MTIQAAMGWTNSHLYEIRAGGVGWSTPYPDRLSEDVADLAQGWSRQRAVKRRRTA